MYEKGQGTGKDLNKALTWYSRSTLGGYLPAQEALVKINNKLKPRGKSRAASVAKKKAKLTRKKVAKKKAAAKPAKVAKKSKAPATVAELLMQGGWFKRAIPSEVLPSNITSCKELGGKIIECLSKERKRNIGTADIVYTTKSLLFDVEENGNFKVAYRNNVLKVKKQAENPDEFADEEVNVKLGWQETEHRLNCQVDQNTKSIDCVKNKFKKTKFTQKI